MTQMVSKPAHGLPIADLIEGEVFSNSAFQIYLDDITEKMNQFLLGPAVMLMSYTVTSVPTASELTGGIIYVSDETGGPVVAFSDGTDWRRVTDRAIIS